MTKGAVVVFARRPELGQVKTRLEPAIGKRLTLELYRAFLSDTLNAARQSGATVVLAHTPGPYFPEQQLADISFEQRRTSFWDRFDAALAEATTHLPAETPLILVGADTPHLSPKFLRESFNALEGYDAVIGECVDGGFYLLGFNSHPIPIANAFFHPSRVAADAVQFLRKASLSVTFLQRQFDVDLPQDLMKLIRVVDSLEAHQANWFPLNTRNVIHTEGMIPMLLEIENTRVTISKMKNPR